MNDAIDRLPPGDETPPHEGDTLPIVAPSTPSDALQSSALVEAIDPTLAAYRRKIILKRLLNDRASVAELESWSYDLMIDPNAAYKVNLIITLLDSLDGQRRLNELEDLLRKERPDMLLTGE